MRRSGWLPRNGRMFDDAHQLSILRADVQSAPNSIHAGRWPVCHVSWLSVRDDKGQRYLRQIHACHTILPAQQDHEWWHKCVSDCMRSNSDCMNQLLPCILSPWWTNLRSSPFLVLKDDQLSLLCTGFNKSRSLGVFWLLRGRWLETLKTSVLSVT